MTITGVVTHKTSDRYATVLVVERGTAMKSDPLAIRCWDRTRRAQADAVEEGDRVEIVIQVKSKQSKTDPTRWFTDAESLAIKVLGKKAETQRTPSDDEIPF